MSKFKVGDQVTILNGNNEHRLNIGESYIIDELEDEGYYVTSRATDKYIIDNNLSSSLRWWINDSNIELTKQSLGNEKKSPSTQELIIQECEDIKNTLLEKNRKYGDSATSKGVLFDIDPVVAIKARLNDKLSRWKNQNSDEDEDVSKDILGYLILLRIATKDVTKIN